MSNLFNMAENAFTTDSSKLAFEPNFVPIEESLVSEEQQFYKIKSFDDKVEQQEEDDDIKELIKLKNNIGSNYFRNPFIYSKIKPFTLEWIYGVNSSCGIKNLTDESAIRIFYSSSNYAIVFNYSTQEMSILEGHQGNICVIACDSKGRFVVTVDDAEKDRCIIVWDCQKLKAVFTAFNICTKCSSVLVAISPNAKYLITVGTTRNGKGYRIGMWLWTLGGDKRNASISIKEYYGSARKVCFNQNVQEHIMVVFEKQVVFLVWNPVQKSFSCSATPTISINNARMGHFNHGTYMHHCHECFVSTSRGCIVVFCNSLYTKQFELGDILDNAKIFRNIVKISNSAITCLETVENLMVVGTKTGKIYFFDQRVRLLHWYNDSAITSIRSISFDVVAADVLVCAKDFCRRKSNTTSNTKNSDDEDKFEDRTSQIEEHTLKYKTSIDAPFLKKNCLILTDDCNIYMTDFKKNSFKSVFHDAKDVITAVETHSEMPYLLIGFVDGRIITYNYDDSSMVAQTVLKTEDKSIVISCLKYCSKSYHLVCGSAIGEIWALDPILLKPKTPKPFKLGKGKVMKIEFSLCCCQFAYYDENGVVYFFTYESESDTWSLRGNIISHYKNINDMIFYPDGQKKSVLCTIGDDRNFVEYNNMLKEENFDILSSERIEQSAVPITFTYFTKMIEGKISCYFIIADDQNKFKLVPTNTKMTRGVALAPAYGCFYNQQIRKIRILGEGENKYMVFMTDHHLGIQMLPLDGNPYKYIGFQTHPKKQLDFCTSFDSKYVFTFAQNERSVYKWKINTKSVDVMCALGGKELDPYYCLIEGGRKGYLFQEMIDLFYYMQILEQGEHLTLPRRIMDGISIDELPDLFRACGYFPTEFEIENLLVDIKYRDYDETLKTHEEINFTDFVKLFINHKPAYGYNVSQLKTHFNTFIKYAPENEESGKILSEHLTQYLVTQGEKITTRELRNCMQILFRKKDFTNLMPTSVDFKFVIRKLLGISGDTIESDGERESDEEREAQNKIDSVFCDQ